VRFGTSDWAIHSEKSYLFFAKKLGFSNYVRKENNVCDVCHHANKLDYNFTLVIIKPKICLKLFLAIYGVLIK